MSDSQFNQIQGQLSEHKRELAERRVDMKEFRADLDALKCVIEANTAAQRELIEAYEGLKSFLKVLGWMEKGATFIVKIAAALGLVWAMWRFGVMEALNNLKGK